MANDKSVMAVIRAARPSFRNANDKVAFAVHASFVASGFQLLAAGRSAFVENALSSSTEEVGVENWNELEDEYAFVYVNPEKGSKKVLVKCLVIDGALSVDAVADGASQNVHCEFSVGDYVQENEGGNYSSQFKNMDTLVNNLNAQVLSKLDESSAPKPTSSNGTKISGNKPGSGAGSHGVNVGGGNEDLYPGAGSGRYPGGGDDLYPGAGAGNYPNRFPVGGGDLYPGPGAGMPSRGGFDDGSMFVGPNDRRFGGVGQPGFPGFPGGLPGIADPRFGGERPFGVPLGARFDPYGPPGLADFDPDCSRRPQGPGSRTHPALEQPGSGSDFI
ncbi:probable proteasome inhibitor [Argentina anserina]|uniref:probable proteasome inhibitor n=1 Tax=Argentina anserina TaxID=57926 RepID=UPI00217674A6|nr:probable proteasome inhibitor [Potentilla anserina]